MSSERCIVYGCSRRGGYKLPVANELRRQWLTAIRWNIPLEPKKSAVICPNHFQDDDFEEVLHDGHERKYLKRDKVPSKFPWNSKGESSDAANCGSASNEDDDGLGLSSSSSESSSSVEESDSPDVVELSSDGDTSVATVDDDCVPINDQLEDRGILGNSTISSSESSPASQKRLKRSSGQELVAKRMRHSDSVSNCSTSSAQSSCSSAASIDVVRPKTKSKETTKDDSDSDCVICEEPVEQIDLTREELVSSSDYQLNWSDHDETYIEKSSDIEGWVNNFLSKNASHFEQSLEGPSSTDTGDDSSDCQIVEEVYPTVKIESDESRDSTNVQLVTSPVRDPKERLSPSPRPSRSPQPNNTSPETSNDPNAPIAERSLSHEAVKSSEFPEVDLPSSPKQKRNFILKLTTKLASKLADKENYSLMKRTEPVTKKVQLLLVKKAKVDDNVVLGEQPSGSDSTKPDQLTSSEFSQLSDTSRFGRSNRYERVLRLPNLLPEVYPTEWFWITVSLNNQHNYAPHCRVVMRKLTKSLSDVKFCLVNGLLSETLLKNVYSEKFEPDLSYGIIYWGHSELADDLFTIQKLFFASYLKVLNPGTLPYVTSDTFADLKILTLPSLYIFHCLIYAHGNFENVVTSDDPPYVALGVQFYQPLPPAIKSLPLKDFIKRVEFFLQKNGFFNVTDYYAGVSKWCDCL